MERRGWMVERNAWKCGGCKDGVECGVYVGECGRWM